MLSPGPDCCILYLLTSADENDVKHLLRITHLTVYAVTFVWSTSSLALE